MSSLAPIVLFVYNRPWHTSLTLEALMSNELADQSTLIIYCDGPKEDATDEQLKKIKEVREIIREKKWCKKIEIIESDRNKGLAASIISGVTEVVNKYGKIIVLEDDIVTSKGFLKYMNEALKMYHNESEVMHVSGYIYPIDNNHLDNETEVVFINIPTCWGWGTWSRSWKCFRNEPNLLYEELIKNNKINYFNIDNKYPFTSHLIANINGSMNTWAIKWYASFFLKNGFSLHPINSLTKNIGFDQSGTNCGSVAHIYKDKKIVNNIKVTNIPIVESAKYRTLVGDFLSKSINTKLTFSEFYKKVLRKLKKILRK